MASSAWIQLRQPKAPKASGVNLATAPVSTKPSTQTVAAYTVAPSLPKYLAIPAIHITQARVVRLGHLADGQIVSPGNIYDSGWYEDSAKPGQPGAMFIFGHVSSWTADGVFYNLHTLKPGDLVTITRGDNKKFTYKVATSKIYDYEHVNMQQVLAPIDPGAAGLNLMTCAGDIIKGTSEFNERLVVFASLVSSS